jgi:hypothetical protein
MVPKIRHPGVSSYFQLLIRVLPVFLMTTETLNRVAIRENTTMNC